MLEQQPNGSQMENGPEKRRNAGWVGLGSSGPDPLTVFLSCKLKYVFVVFT